MLIFLFAYISLVALDYLIAFLALELLFSQAKHFCVEYKFFLLLLRKPSILERKKKESVVFAKLNKKTNKKAFYERAKVASNIGATFSRMMGQGRKGKAYFFSENMIEKPKNREKAERR